GGSAAEDAHVPGARLAPDGVTLVAPPWNFPVAIPVGGVLAALAAGAAVLAKPAPPAPRCLEVAVDAVHAGLRDAVAAGPQDFAGLGAVSVTDVVQYVRVPDDDLRTHLVTHDDGARVVLTCSIEPARVRARLRAVAAVAPGARRDVGQERARRHALGGPRPRGRGPRAVGVRSRGAEVLGGVARDPRRLGGGPADGDRAARAAPARGRDT